MFRSEEKCSGENCNSHYIQNKKKHLCGDCVFKMSHGGLSKTEVYEQRSKKRRQANPVPRFIARDEYETNRINQDNVKEIDQEEEKKFFEKETRVKKPKPIRKISTAQAEIERKYKATCIDMDYTSEPVCSGCGRYQGGDIKLSHSHLISRKKCKEIGRLELIYERKNLTYHCMDFGENKGCHLEWESPIQRKNLQDYHQNLSIIREIAPEIVNDYL